MKDKGNNFIVLTMLPYSRVLTSPTWVFFCPHHHLTLHPTPFKPNLGLHWPREKLYKAKSDAKCSCGLLYFQGPGDHLRNLQGNLIKNDTFISLKIFKICVLHSLCDNSNKCMFAGSKANFVISANSGIYSICLFIFPGNSRNIFIPIFKVFFLPRG